MSRPHTTDEMWTSDSEAELAAASPSSSSTTTTSAASPPPSPPPSAASLLRQPRNRRRLRRTNRRIVPAAAAHEPEAEDVWRGAQWEAAWPGRRDARPVLLASDGGGGGAGQNVVDGVGRSRSLTDDDLEDLKGCADLGFGFSYDEIPELRDTLPALELCYSMTQRLLDDDKHHQAADSDADAAPTATTTTTVTNWKISSPGDSPDEVKARLKYWAQAVACTVRLCS